MALEELHIQLEGEKGETVNEDYDSLPVEMKRRIDYTSITVIEIKIDDKEQRAKIWMRRVLCWHNKNYETEYYSL